jgi:hypothetical protein
MGYRSVAVCVMNLPSSPLKKELPPYFKLLSAFAHRLCRITSTQIYKMDPISITASIVTLIAATQATAETVKNLWGLHNVAGPLNRAINQVRGINQILAHHLVDYSTDIHVGE